MFIQGKGLSTWEAGEILKMSHYKYLELKARAEKFFKLFSDYFELHPSLVNPKSPIEPRFRDYIFGAMVKRLPKEEAFRRCFLGIKFYNQSPYHKEYEKAEGIRG